MNTTNELLEYQNSAAVDLDSILRLQGLKSKLDQQEPTERINFVLTVFKANLYRALVTHELYDEFDLGERDLSRCFEMYDGDIVIKGVMKEALNNTGMKASIKEMGAWDHWLAIYQQQETQLSLFG